MTATELTPKQRRAIAALVQTGEIQAAADATGVSRTSLYAWLKTPAFQDALRAAESDALHELTRGLLALGKRSTRAVTAVLDDPGATHGERLRAADLILGRLLQLRELVDLEGRISALEQRIEGVPE